MTNRFVLDYDETSSPFSSDVDQELPSQLKKSMSSKPPSFDPSSTPVDPSTSRQPQFSDRPTHFSTTPAGPPPSSIYGSSALGGRKLLFKPPADSPSTKSFRSQPSKPLPPRTANGTPARPKSNAGPGHSSGPTSSRPLFAAPQQSSSGGNYEESMMSMEEVDEDDFEAPAYGSSSRFKDSTASAHQQPQDLRSSMGPPTRLPPRKKASASSPSRLRSKGNEDIIPGIARSLASQSAIAILEETDELVIHTEASMQDMAKGTRKQTNRDQMAEKLTARVADLIVYWTDFVSPKKPSTSNARIGPPDSATGLEKANYLVSLLLMLRHRPLLAEQNNMRAPSKSLISTRQKSAPVPLILLEWLDNYHVSYEQHIQAILSARPNCSAHEYFWDVVRCLVLRGKLPQAMHLLEEADFQYAMTAKDDGAEEPGYHGPQLQAVHSAVNRARHVLAGCPSLQGQWDTGDDDWDLYRKRVSVELAYLAELTADDMDEDDEEDDFRADNFAPRRQGRSLMKSMQGSTHRLPLTIYQNLKGMYSILLGATEEILVQSEDWLEAATSLTVWWDGSYEDDINLWRKSVVQSNSNNESSQDDRYLSRLSAAFLCVTDPESERSLQINTISSVEVGLGAVLQGDYSSVLRILQTLSLPLASVVAEIGTTAGWLDGTGVSENSMLDPEDLMVLSHAAPPSGISKDDVLSKYAEALFDKTELQNSNGNGIEGWELALSVASRFDNTALIRTTISDFLDRLDLTNQQRMDKLVDLCSALGLQEEAQKVCERFADHLVNNTSDYGTAMLCYARSHTPNKLRQLMDLLVSYCLVQSKAYPPEDEMDDNLRALVASPKAALAGLVNVDPEAADMLQFHLVGYACMRRFYNLRDEDILAKKTKSSHAPIARRRLAAKALLAAISSSADSIYGGLYDAERQSAIQIDGLLTLLGEATAFLTSSNGTPMLTVAQLYTLLAAVEDLQTVNSRVYEATEECLQAALRQYHGSQPPSPHAMLKKSMSSGSHSNFSFSMMGSEMLAGSGTSAGGKSLGSALLVGKDDSERGWDWRMMFKDKGSTGHEVLRHLRMGIIKELSIAELDESR